MTEAPNVCHKHIEAQKSYAEYKMKKNDFIDVKYYDSNVHI